jgi:hypothetical protein
MIYRVLSAILLLVAVAMAACSESGPNGGVTAPNPNCGTTGVAGPAGGVAGPNGTSCMPVAVPASQTVTPNTNQSDPTNSTTQWRDQEVSTGWFTRGEIDLRACFNAGVGNGYCSNPNNTGLFFNVGVACSGCVEIGLLGSHLNYYATYVQATPASCITNWPSSGTHTFTFGVKGFTVYFKIDGVVATDTCQTNAALGNFNGAIQYYEYRPTCCVVGSPAMWCQGTCPSSATLTFFVNQQLYSTEVNGSTDNSGNGTFIGGYFDPRDFGMRNIGPVTGSMSAGSPILNLNSPADIRVGDHIVVEIGGESGFPSSSNPYAPTFPNLVGVGGTAPVLNYANQTAMNADTSQPNGQMAWLQTDGTVWTWTSGSPGSWAQNTPCVPSGGSGGPCYRDLREAISLIAWVTAVNGSPATQVTLNTNSVAATTNANVRLDTAPSFYPLTTEPSQWFNGARNNDGLFTINNLTVSIPAGDWYEVGGVTAGDNHSNVTIYGQGSSTTTIHAVKGWPSYLFDVGSNTLDGITVSNMGFDGNLCDLCSTTTALSGTNRNFNGNANAGSGFGGRNILLQNINCLNTGACLGMGPGPNLIMQNNNVTMTQPVRAYLEWEFQINDCTVDSTPKEIINSSVTGPYLIKAYALFGCHGGKIIHSAGQNALYDTNSSTSWVIDFDTTGGVYDGTTDTITANSFINENNGSPNEGVLQINDNAFGSGSGGTVNNARIIQQGYVDSSSYHAQFGYNNSIPIAKILSPQNNITIQGQYPGKDGRCHSDLGGYFIAPNFDPNSDNFGSAIDDGSADNTYNGLRIVGTGVAYNGSNFRWGNIFNDNGPPINSGTTITNNVVDVIQPGGIQSGNQTNASYGGCE